MQKQTKKYKLYLVIILFIVVLIMNTEIVFYIVQDKANGEFNDKQMSLRTRIFSMRERRCMYKFSKIMLKSSSSNLLNESV